MLPFRRPPPPTECLHLWEGRVLSEPIFIVEWIDENGREAVLGTWTRAANASRAAHHHAAEFGGVPIRVSLWPPPEGE